MLIATPYRDFDVRDKSPPKIISEIRKNYSSCNFPNIRTKISGDVLLKSATDRHWFPRRVNIRGGQLHVSPLTHGVHHTGGTAMKLALRHLSLQAGPLTNSLALCRGQNIVLTLQAANENDFDKWVKTIAIELIRQTPLDAIKYLDILSIAQCLKKEKSLEKDWNFNYLSVPPPLETPLPPIKPPIETQKVEDLLKKCQNSENYVPVKEKLFLFESLCKLGRKVRSTEDVSNRIQTDNGCQKKARSMHDLSNINSQIAVREICKYFENRSDCEEAKQLETIKTRQK